MQKFLSLLFSRRALAVVGVLVLALLVWFVGPLVSFDTLRPLASVGSRVVTIALLLMLLVLWLVNWSMSIIGISVLCLAIGFVTPLLALGDVHPFAPLWVRLTLIGFILLMYALYGLYRLWRALRMGGRWQYTNVCGAVSDPGDSTAPGIFEVQPVGGPIPIVRLCNG